MATREEEAKELGFQFLKVTDADITTLVKKEIEYGGSWKRRGGIGAFMMLARKWDRIEAQVSQKNYDLFEALLTDMRPEGILDDIQDLRRYLILVENEVVQRRNWCRHEIPKDKCVSCGTSIQGPSVPDIGKPSSF